MFRALTCGFAACVVVAAATSVWAEAATGSTVTRAVSSSRVWTDTGIALRAGDLLVVDATGRIHYGKPPIDRMAPSGIPWGPPCATMSKHTGGWPVPGLACWSLIGRIGSEQPFEIGVAKTLRVARGGELFLGVNDNHLVDNSGAWSATVSVTPIATTTASKPVTSSRSGSTSKPGASSKSAVIAVAILAAVVALGALLALSARRRRRTAARDAGPAQAAPEPAAWVPAAAADLSADILPGQRGNAGTHGVVTPIEADSTDVNIFEVEHPDLTSLRVGYSYFPEGTVLHWRVQQHGSTAATGEFATLGGRSTSHFVTLELGAELAAAPAASDIDFTWTIGGVPFGYRVRREPGA